MPTKKPLFIQNLNPNTIFTIIIWITIAWILSRPLQSVGRNTYNTIGTIANNAFNVIASSQSSTQELINSKKLVKKQSHKIALLETKVNSLEDKAEKVDKLKNLLSLKRNIRYKTISSSVTGRSPDSWHKQIVIDKGLNSKIMLGNSVLSSLGVVGQVIEVNKDHSIVQLISDPSFKLGCRIKNKNVLGILSSKTKSIGQLEFIPIGTKIKIGDIVETSGIQTKHMYPTYPPGHPIGEIRKISRKTKRASDLYVEVKLFEDLTSLSEVLVFTPN